MQGRSYKYLTNAFVEWLGLESWLYEHRSKFLIRVGDEVVAFKGYDFAVVYNHGLYLREPDGLAWVRKP